MDELADRASPLADRLDESDDLDDDLDDDRHDVLGEGVLQAVSCHGHLAHSSDPFHRSLDCVGAQRCSQLVRERELSLQRLGTPAKNV